MPCKSKKRSAHCADIQFSAFQPVRCNNWTFATHTHTHMLYLQVLLRLPFIYIGRMNGFKIHQLRRILVELRQIPPWVQIKFWASPNLTQVQNFWHKISSTATIAFSLHHHQEDVATWIFRRTRSSHFVLIAAKEIAALLLPVWVVMPEPQLCCLKPLWVTWWSGPA